MGKNGALQVSRKKLRAQAFPLTFTPTSEVPRQWVMAPSGPAWHAQPRGLHEATAQVGSGRGVRRGGLVGKGWEGEASTVGGPRWGGAGQLVSGPLPVPKGLSSAYQEQCFGGTRWSRRSTGQGVRQAPSPATGPPPASLSLRALWAQSHLACRPSALRRRSGMSLKTRKHTTAPSLHFPAPSEQHF